MNPERGFVEKGVNTLKKIKLGIGIGATLVGLPELAALAFLSAGGSWWLEKRFARNRAKQS